MSNDEGRQAVAETRGSVSRRAMLGAVGGSVAALSGCLTGGDESSGADSITVSVYGGAYGNVFEETVAGAYEEETGTTVNVQKAWSNRVSQLQSASQGDDGPPYDVIGLSGFNYLTARNEELLTPVRYDNIPNAEKIWPFFREYRTDEYGVPGEGGVLGIVYREGDPHATTWSEFMEVDAPAGMNGGYWKNPLLIAALLTDETAGVGEIYDPEMHDAMFSTLEDLAENVATWYRGGADVWSALGGGTIDYGAFYYASGLAGIDNRPDKNYGMVLPEMSPGYFTNFCVTNTDKRDEAERFLDFMLRTEVQTEWHNNGYYVPANREVAGSYADRVQGAYPESNEGMESFFVLGDSERLSAYQSELSDRFTEITTA